MWHREAAITLPTQEYKKQQVNYRFAVCVSLPLFEK
jgi:hypothetical protein